MVIDKHDRLTSLSGATIELGCGEKKTPGSIGIDAIDYPDVDIVGDVHEVLAAMPPASVEHVYSAQFFEHITDLPRMMEQLGRVVQPGGTMQIQVPHACNPHYWSDPTHKQPFGLYTFAYLTDSTIFHRPVPTYDTKTLFELTDARLMFRSPAWPLRNKAQRVIELVVNSSRWLQEFHEENLSHLIPPYGIDFRLHRKD